MTRIAGLSIHDVRFPTSEFLHGSDAMNADPDYSAAYVRVLTTDEGLSGHGFAFTIGRGNEVVCKAIEALAPMVIGRDVADLWSEFGTVCRAMAWDSQLRWLGPEKGVMHLALGAVVNALWDLFAKRAGKPVWLLIAELEPAELVELLDFSYVEDLLDAASAREHLEARRAGWQDRVRRLHDEGYPAYLTSAGWLGYDDDQVERLVQDAGAEGWRGFKLKVGRDEQDDLRRARLVRRLVGDADLMLDANQVWGVAEAQERIRRLAEVEPKWIEEPTNPDDVLGLATIATAVAPIALATGEHVHNRVMFKQLLQAEAMSYCQVDMCRVGGINEAIVVALMCAVEDVAVCPHTGGVGLCEYGQHLSFLDYAILSGTRQGRALEYVDHLHEHFVEPVTVESGRYYPMAGPGFGVELLPASLDRYEVASWEVSDAAGPSSRARR